MGDNQHRDVPHHRLLAIEFESGAVVKVRFDQGLGYWQLRLPSHRDSYMNMQEYPHKQMEHLLRVGARADVLNSADWPTDVVVETMFV